MTIYTNPQHRHDFVLLFDVTDGNPNGDPDGGNMPRTDPETLEGIVTDVCLKRKVRNYVTIYEAHEASEDQKSRLKIFVEHHGVLNEQIQRAYTEQGLATVKPVNEVIKDVKILEGLRQLKSDVPDAFNAFTFTDNNEESEDVVASLGYNGLLSDTELKEQVFGLLEGESSFTKNVKTFITTLTKKAGKPPDKNRANAAKAQTWMCDNFYDVRMFGAVMSTGLNAGQVRGAMQITFARSLDPVLPQDLSITRVAITKSEDRNKKETEMGRKTFIPYGLYMAHGFYSPYLAESTGVSEFDLKLFWEALVNMWDLDRSASRGMMAPRGLYIFSHENKLGNAPAHKLFERIKPELKETITVPRQFSDYIMSVDDADLPSGITLTRLIEG